MRKFILVLLLISPSFGFSIQTKFITEQGFQNIWLWQLSNTAVIQENGIGLSQNNKQIYSNDMSIWTGTEIGNYYYLGSVENASLIQVDRKTFAEKTLYTSDNRSLVGAIVPDGDGILASFSPESELVHFDAKFQATTNISLSNSYIWDIVPNPKGGFYVLTGANAEVYEYQNYQLTNPIAIEQEEHLLQGLIVDNTLWVLGEKALYKKDQQKFIAVASFNGTASGFSYVNDTFYVAQSYTNKVDNQVEINSDILAITKNGVVNTIYSLKGFYFTTITAQQNKLYVGSDHMGLYIVYDLKNNTYLYSSLGQGKILDIITQNNELLFITSETSGIWRMENQQAQEGSFISEIYDAKNLAIWGKLLARTSVPANTSIQFFVQSGATADPQYWADWKEIQTNAQISAPNARYMRFKAVLKSKNGNATPIVYEVKIPYTQFNLAPEFESTTVSQDKQKINVNWNVQDPNKDKLEYKIYLSDESKGSVLLTPKAISNTNYTFNSSLYPSGNKIITIEASDLPSNTSQTALTAKHVSTPVMFDSQPPAITMVSQNRNGKGITLSFKVQDNYTIITRASIIVNGTKRISLLPVDKIFDSKEEEFLVDIPLNDELNFIQIQSVDYANNTASQGITISK